MSAIELVWYAIVALACLIAAGNWRKGVYAGVLIDVLRDPVRKLIPEQPVMITLSGTAVWLCIIVAVLLSRRDQLKLLKQRYPQLRVAMTLLLLAIIPAAGVTVVTYSGGWIVASIGAMSYLLPTLGVLAGFAFLRKEGDIANLMLWYVVVNVPMLLSVPMEYMKMDVPALGGIDHVWIRYRTGYIVELMCGWYRSPDIMGLHAAHVIIFGIILCVRPQSRGKIAWLLPVLFAGFCVLVSGRRKMLGMPLVFVAVYLILGTIYQVARVGRLTAITVVCAMFGSFIAILFWSPDESAEYTDFATTLFTEGAQRSHELIVGSTISTLQQSGILGGGLGMATQGKYYAKVSTTRSQRGWQEDGVSRLIFEFGLPGILFLSIALYLLLASVLQSLRGLPKRSREILMQLALVAVIASDAASFVISHQQFSGDPVNALLVTLMLGMVLKFPTVNSPPAQASTLAATPRT